MGAIAGWQGALVAVAAATLVGLGRGSPVSLVAGAAVMLASLALQKAAFSAAFRRNRRPAVALLVLLAKLSLILALAWVGLRTAWIGPMSFAAGATTLPVAIVLDVCYLHGSSRRRRATTH